MKIRFEWDESNAVAHLKKHKIRFETAARVFADTFALVAQDDDSEVICIISARKADKQERKRYENTPR